NPLQFFCSSRRRHTRWPRDWSSDVCSSDLGEVKIMVGHAQLSTGHPKLQKAGIDVHQGCTLEVWKQRGTDSIVKIQQQIRALKDRFSLATGHVEVLFRRFG